MTRVVVTLFAILAVGCGSDEITMPERREAPPEPITFGDLDYSTASDMQTLVNVNHALSTRAVQDNYCREGWWHNHLGGTKYAVRCTNDGATFTYWIAWRRNQAYGPYEEHSEVP